MTHVSALSQTLRIRHRLVSSLALVMLACSQVSIVHGQVPTTNTPTRVISPAEALPVVPLTARRSAEGTEAEQKFQAEREQDPVASFIDTLKGNDAAIQVVVGQGRLLTLKNEKSVAGKAGAATVAVGDPTILDFQVLPNPRMIRLIGLRTGVTDLSITAADGETHTFEVQVTHDLTLLRAQMRQLFPDALIKLGQMRDHIIVEGEARSTMQVGQIIQTLEAYASSRDVKTELESDKGNGERQQTEIVTEGLDNPQDQQFQAGIEASQVSTSKSTSANTRIINLLRVPGVQQVLLKVQIAELNRTALRNIGADLLGVANNGTVVGTTIGGGLFSAADLFFPGGTGSIGSSPTNTAFGIFPSADFGFLLHALRRNSVVSILAEPNLIALNGHHANFLAGGEFPVPVPQNAGGLTSNVTILFKQFGVRLDFQPFVLDDETVRLAVMPEVSTIDFQLGTTLVLGGTPVPGLNTRRTETTVELKQGQTLAIAGLLRVDLEAETNRIPGLGDLPVIGTMFSNTTHRRVEKELIVMVTPHLIQPMEAHQVPALPGTEVKDPTDCEFYFLSRIEGHTDANNRPTVDYDCIERHQLKYEQSYIQGPVGFSTEYSQ